MNHTRIDSSLISQLPRHTVALILAGGRGSRLHGLTDNRAKPAVYFGGRFRIIDFALSNCINSGINRIGVVTQYKPHSLLRHIQHSWSFLNPERNEFIDLLPASQQLNEDYWYRGTADAVYQNMGIMRDHYSCKYVLVLAGDHIYKMNYTNMLIDHINQGGQCTVACLEVDKEEARGFGVMHVNDKYQITNFIEKPDDPPTIPSKPDTSLASMGIYIFNADYLYKLLEQQLEIPGSSYDFGNDLIPYAVQQGTAYAHIFERSCVRKESQNGVYWRDVGTIDSYWEANMDLLSPTSHLDLSDAHWPIRSGFTTTQPTHFIQHPDAPKNQLQNSLIAGGCTIEDAKINDSILFHNVRIKPKSIVDSSIIFPQTTIGHRCRLRNCIIDKGCHIPDGMVIGENSALDAQYFYRSPKGIVLVTPDMLEKLQTTIQVSDSQAMII